MLLWWGLFSSSTPRASPLALLSKVCHSAWRRSAALHLPRTAYKYCWPSDAEIYLSTEGAFLKCQILFDYYYFLSPASDFWTYLREIRVSMDLVVISHSCLWRKLRSDYDCPRHGGSVFSTWDQGWDGMGTLAPHISHYSYQERVEDLLMPILQMRKGREFCFCSVISPVSRRDVAQSRGWNAGHFKSWMLNVRSSLLRNCSIQLWHFKAKRNWCLWAFWLLFNSVK